MTPRRPNALARPRVPAPGAHPPLRMFLADGESPWEAPRPRALAMAPQLRVSGALRPLATAAALLMPALALLLIG